MLQRLRKVFHTSAADFQWELISCLDSLQSLVLQEVPYTAGARRLNLLGSLTGLTMLLIGFMPSLNPDDLRSVAGGFPQQWSRLVSLEKLDLQAAGVSAFPHIPDCISSLVKLKVRASQQ